MTPQVTVVMPAHNEEALLARSVGDVGAALRERGLGFEILVAENGSTDGTLALAHDLAAKDPAVRVLTRPTADYGRAMRAGILAVAGDDIVVFDTDYYDGDFVDAVLPLLRGDEPPAIVVGSKRAPGTSDTPFYSAASSGYFSGRFSACEVNASFMCSRASIPVCQTAM